MSVKHAAGEPSEQPDYLSYLLRLWRACGGTETTWRASLESALSGETHNFASLDLLCDFLQEQTSHAQGAGRGKDDHTTTVILVIHCTDPKRVTD
jgi:hypothetical protein